MRNRRRGSYLLLALFFTVVAGTGSLVLLDLLPSEATSLKLARRDTEASQAADAGVRDTMAWISFQLKNNIEPLTISPLTRSGSIGRWSWQAVITADPQTPPNPPKGIRMYRVLSTALWDGEPKRQIDCWLQAGISFAKYAAFTNNTPGPGLVNFELRQNQTTVDGAFRTNGTLKVRAPFGYFGSPLPANRSFLGLVTATGSTGSGDGIDYPAASPSSAADYDHMNSLGKSGFQVGVSPMAMPSGPQPFADAAWGGVAPATPPAGVTVNAAGGIFVNGAVNSLVLSVDAGGNSVYGITQGATVTTVTRVSDTATGGAPVGSRLVQVGSGVPTVVAGLGSGVLYSSGDISAVNGTVKGPNTLATDFGSGRDIEIAGNLLRDDTFPGAKPTSTRDNLGLVADEVRVTDNTTAVPRSSASILTIYASIFANDRFWVEKYWVPGFGQGKMEVFGSIIGTNSWSTGTSFPSTATASGFGYPTPGPISYGSFRLVTDANSGFFPPPLFPSSEKGQMEIRYWKESPL